MGRSRLLFRYNGEPRLDFCPFPFPFIIIIMFFYRHSLLHFFPAKENGMGCEFIEKKE